MRSRKLRCFKLENIFRLSQPSDSKQVNSHQDSFTTNSLKIQNKEVPPDTVQSRLSTASIHTSAETKAWFEAKKLCYQVASVKC